MDPVQRLISRLYRTGVERPAEGFQHWALQQLKAAHQLTDAQCGLLERLQKDGDMMVNAAVEVYTIDMDIDELCDTLKTIARVRGPRSPRGSRGSGGSAGGLASPRGSPSPRGKTKFDLI